LNVIKSFKGRLAELVWKGEAPKRFPPDLVRPAQRKLAMLNAAVTVEALRSPPGNQLEALKGDRRGQWSIRINDQFRVCFRWKDGNADDVEIVDNH
jgi:proteic killer suppression protein